MAETPPPHPTPLPPPCPECLCDWPVLLICALVAVVSIGFALALVL